MTDKRLEDSGDRLLKNKTNGSGASWPSNPIIIDPRQH